MRINLKQRLLPPSSASFHYYEQESTSRLDDLIKINQRLTEQLDNITHRLDDTINRADELDRKVQILQQQLSNYSLALLNGGGGHEATFETRCKLFRDLPEATGQMRRSQQVTAKLMIALDKILSNNNLEYWFGYGSLLGAYVRGGYIPWDDDIDICMHRDDFHKLLDILKGNKHFRVTTVFDSVPLCLQYRFCLRNENVPSFIDIGIWDYATEYTPVKDKRLQEIRIELMNELTDMLNTGKLPYWQKQGLFFEPGCGKIVSEQCLHPDEEDEKLAAKEGKLIKKTFQKYIQQAIDEGILLPETDRKKAKGYAYSLDNLLMVNRQMLYPKSMIHPTIRLPYEGFTIECPHDSVAFLNACYADWPLMPNDDSLLAQRHFDKAILDRPEVKAAITEFLVN